MPASNIILTAPNTYTADIDGTVWSGITPASRFYVDIIKAIDAGVVVQQPTSPTAEELLTFERSQLNPFAAAFWQAMKQVPAVGFEHLLDKVEQTVATARVADQYADIVLWAEKVTQVIRLHPQMEDFRILFGATPEKLDDLFRLAMQIEAGS